MRKITLAVTGLSAALLVVCAVASSPAARLAAQDAPAGHPTAPTPAPAPMGGIADTDPQSGIVTLPPMVPAEVWAGYTAALEASKEYKTARELESDAVKAAVASWGGESKPELTSSTFLRWLMDTGYETRLPGGASAVVVYDEFYSPNSANQQSAFSLKVTSTESGDQTWQLNAAMLHPYQFSFVSLVTIPNALNRKVENFTASNLSVAVVEEKLCKLAGVDYAICCGQSTTTPGPADIPVVSVNLSGRSIRSCMDFVAALVDWRVDVDASLDRDRVIDLGDIDTALAQRDYHNVVEGVTPQIQTRLDALRYCVRVETAYAAEHRAVVKVRPEPPKVQVLGAVDPANVPQGQPAPHKR